MIFFKHLECCQGICCSSGCDDVDDVDNDVGVFCYDGLPFILYCNNIENVFVSLSCSI
jgi:hypothetical protein